MIVIRDENLFPEPEGTPLAPDTEICAGKARGRFAIAPEQHRDVFAIGRKAARGHGVLAGVGTP